MFQAAGVAKFCRCDTPVRVDPDRRIVFVRDPQRDLPRADRGGRALATLFDGDRRRVAQAWRTAWDLAKGGRPATLLEFAQQKDKRKQEEIKADIARECGGASGAYRWQASPGRRSRAARSSCIGRANTRSRPENTGSQCIETARTSGHRLPEGNRSERSGLSEVRQEEIRRDVVAPAWSSRVNGLRFRKTKCRCAATPIWIGKTLASSLLGWC